MSGSAVCWIRFFGFLSGVTAACGAGYFLLTEDINESAREVQRKLDQLAVTVDSVGLDVVLSGHCCCSHAPFV
jgi:hypothetical protein